MDQNVGQPPAPNALSVWQLRKLPLKIRGALAPFLKVALQYRPGLQIN